MRLIISSDRFRCGLTAVVAADAVETGPEDGIVDSVLDTFSCWLGVVVVAVLVEEGSEEVVPTDTSDG